MDKKILIVTPKFPFPPTGACEQDRFWGIKDFIRYGFEVRVITKLFGEANEELALKTGKELDIKIFPVQYKFKNFSRKEKFKNFLSRLFPPFYLDGSAFEYKDKEIQGILKSQIEEWKPDLVWFDYTYLWPLYGIAKKRKIPIITRSINFEAIHFLLEDGINFVNILRSIPKFFTEYITLKNSDLLFSITPKEEKLYKKIGFKNKIKNLPLRGLPHCLKTERTVRETDILHIFFMGSTYNVHHNRDAAKFILQEIAPGLQRKSPGKFIFHILGSKLPSELEKYVGENTIYEGPKYGQELEKFLSEMDVAVVPSLFGAGMQQKVFEPLARGIPAVISERGLAGYPFKNKEHLLLAKSAEDFIERIIELQDINLRKKLSKNSMELSSQIFSQRVIDNIVLNAVNNLCAR